MPSELDTHDILFNPLKKRRAEQTARRAADPPEPSEGVAVRPRADSDAPPTDRAVAYAIAEADAAPLISSKLIAGIAVVAAIATAAVLMRTPKLETSADDETAAVQSHWWTAAREQWANETMRVWPIVIRGQRSGAKAAVASKTPTIAGANPASAPAAAASAATAEQGAPTPNAASASTPSRANAPARTGNPYSSAPQATPGAPTAASDNPYGETPAPRARKPAAASTDNPY